MVRMHNLLMKGDTMDLIYHDYSSDSYNPSENQPVVAGVKDEDIVKGIKIIGKNVRRLENEYKN